MPWNLYFSEFVAEWLNSKISCDLYENVDNCGNKAVHCYSEYFPSMSLRQYVARKTLYTNDIVIP